MPEDKNETSTKRVPLTPTNFNRLRDFARGLGVSYDDAIAFLLGLAVEPGEDDLFAGRRLRDKAQDEAEDEPPIAAVQHSHLQRFGPQSPFMRIADRPRPEPHYEDVSE